jgi:PEP-CTERM motif
MKLTRMFCLLILVGSVAIAAHAQTPVDPVIRTNSSAAIGPPGGDPPCGGAGEPFCLDSDSLSVNYATATFPLDFVNNTGSNLYELILTFTNVPANTMFQCFTDIWTDCSQSSDGTTTTFTMSDDPADSSGPCVNNGSAGGTCPGYLPPGYEAMTTKTPLTSETPEPESVILFGTGLIALFLGMKRRVRVRA